MINNHHFWHGDERTNNQPGDPSACPFSEKAVFCNTALWDRSNIYLNYHWKVAVNFKKKLQVVKWTTSLKNVLFWPLPEKGWGEGRGNLGKTQKKTTVQYYFVFIQPLES